MLRTLAVACLLLPLVKCCSEQRDKGFTCESNTSSMRFFHDAKSGRCQPFFFLGCGGNGNNFIDKRTCESSCLPSSSPSKPTSQGTQPGNMTIVAACSLPTSAVLQDKATACSSPSDCLAGHACSNGNCCPTKEHICSLTPDNGNEATEFVHRGRYAWIPSLRNCIRFSYFGVNGNANNFPSYKECVAFCATL